MSATPNNIGAGWSAAPVVASPIPEAGAKENALQALLAFACIHGQAERRRRAANATIPETTRPSLGKEEEFALDEILQLVADRARSITGADGVAVALADESAIVCRATSGKTVPDVGMRVDPKSGFSGACLRRRETVRCDDSETDSRVNAEACRRLGTRSMVAVPLATRQRIIGLVEAFSNESYGFNDSDVRSLSLLAELILAALRPEEEDRLAELAAKVLPIAAAERAALPTDNNKTTAETTSSATPAVVDSTIVAPGSTPEVHKEALELPKPVAKAEAPAKVLVDEKFLPATVADADAKAPAVRLPKASPGEATKSLPELATVSVTAVPPLQPALLPAKKETLPHRWPVSMLVTAASVLVALALLGLIIWKAQHLGQAISANTHAAAEVKAVESQAPEIATPAPPLKPGAVPELTAIQHTSSADSSTVIIDVQDQVQYEAHSLDNPPRIYFDLHDTKLSAALANQSIAVNDAFVKRIRVAQGADDVTRVVLETIGQPDFSVSLDSNPYRLTIQLHKAAAAPASTQPAVKPSPAINLLPKKSSSKPSPAAAGRFSIVLDAGHGGWDLGTVGRKGLLEKDLVLDIVLRLGKLLEDKLGAEVIYTRQDDSYLPLEKRAEIANLAKADLFLSVHANYSDLPTARGVETYFSRTYSSEKARSESAPQLQQVNWSSVVDIRAKVMDSRRFAADVQQALFNGVAGRNPEIKNRGVKEAQYVVLTGTQMPAVLAEVSFVSSPADEDKLQNSEYRQAIAEALYRGIVQYRKDEKVAIAKK